MNLVTNEEQLEAHEINIKNQLPKEVKELFDSFGEVSDKLSKNNIPHLLSVIWPVKFAWTRYCLGPSENKFITKETVGETSKNVLILFDSFCQFFSRQMNADIKLFCKKTGECIYNSSENE